MNRIYEVSLSDGFVCVLLSVAFCHNKPEVSKWASLWETEENKHLEVLGQLQPKFSWSESYSSYRRAFI